MPVKSSDLLEEIKALLALDRSALVEEWRSLYGDRVPKNISTLLLRRAVAYRIQERMNGGLKPATRQYLRQVAQRDKPVAAVKVPEPDLTAGSRLIREWNGKTYEITKLAGDRFEMDGKTYRSLSEIARLITGAKWSGPRFFGLVKVKSR